MESEGDNDATLREDSVWVEATPVVHHPFSEDDDAARFHDFAWLVVEERDVKMQERCWIDSRAAGISEPTTRRRRALSSASHLDNIPGSIEPQNTDKIPTVLLRYDRSCTVRVIDL